MSISALMEIIREEEFDVTLTGGDPLYHPEFVKEISRQIKSIGLSTWVYTGYTWEEIQEDENLVDCLRDVEAIVEGRYIERLHDPDLQFRGSSNQRIIRL